MNEPIPPNWLDGWKVAELAYGLVLGLLAWMGNRMSNKIDALERTSVTREELKDNFAQMREDRKSMHDQNQEALQRIEEKLEGHQLAGVIVTRVKRNEDDIQDLRDWKNQVDPYITRRGDP